MHAFSSSQDTMQARRMMQWRTNKLHHTQDLFLFISWETDLRSCVSAMLKYIHRSIISGNLQVESRFPVGEVATNVCNAHPEAVPLFLGKLHEVGF